MIEDVTGISRIRMLYLQLLYRCNFSCLHCFHGERLRHADAFSGEEAVNLIRLMRGQYGTDAVTLLGGEPFLHKELPQVVRYTRQELGMRVEICTTATGSSVGSQRSPLMWTCCVSRWRESAAPMTAFVGRVATMPPSAR